jgi:K+-transporting ATPase ATPase C chain
MDKNEMARDLRACVLLFIVVCVLSIVYTLFMNWSTQTIMPYQANGSLLYVNGTVVGSELFGQNFSSPGYFHGRPSAVDYNGSNSGGSNLGPTSANLMEQVRQRIEKVRKENGLSDNVTVPADLVLASGSGLDPHISVAGALLQVPRVAGARGLPLQSVRALVERHIERPTFGIFGQERVNVLKLNLALDGLTRSEK